MAVKEKAKKTPAHLFFIPGIILAVAAAGGYIVTGGVEWYQMIQKPAWIPPSQVFSWAIMTIYILGGYSAITVWDKFKRDARFRTINLLYAVSIFLFLLYTFFFFRLHIFTSSILVAILLEVTVVFLAVLIWPQSKRASAALFPAAVWFIFGAYMCYVLWRVNDLQGIVT